MRRRLTDGAMPLSSYRSRKKSCSQKWSEAVPRDIQQAVLRVLHTGVIDQDINRSKLRRRLLHRIGSVLFHTEIGLDHVAFSAKAFHSLSRFLRIAVFAKMDNGDIGAFLCIGQCNCAADTAVPSRYDCFFPDSLPDALYAGLSYWGPDSFPPHGRAGGFDVGAGTCYGVVVASVLLLSKMPRCPAIINYVFSISRSEGEYENQSTSYDFPFISSVLSFFHSMLIVSNSPHSPV